MHLCRHKQRTNFDIRDPAHKLKLRKAKGRMQNSTSSTSKQAAPRKKPILQPAKPENWPGDSEAFNPKVSILDTQCEIFSHVGFVSVNLSEFTRRQQPAPPQPPPPPRSRERQTVPEIKASIGFQISGQDGA